MATTSITKEFEVKDEKAYFDLLSEIDKKTDKTARPVESSNVERGTRLLKQFLFR